jgi:hypothetical protein
MWMWTLNAADKRRILTDEIKSYTHNFFKITLDFSFTKEYKELHRPMNFLK